MRVAIVENGRVVNIAIGGPGRVLKDGEKCQLGDDYDSVNDRFVDHVLTKEEFNAPFIAEIEAIEEKVFNGFPRTFRMGMIKAGHMDDFGVAKEAEIEALRKKMRR